jgi:hypothetical protein
MTDRINREERPELHNPSCDEEVALLGGCGQVHLPTGGTCTLAHNHAGSCAFKDRDEVLEHLPTPRRSPPVDHLPL